MAPFGVDTIAPYLSSGPPALTSSEYAVAFNEVKKCGSIEDPNPERAAIAFHWQAEGGTVRESGLWFKIALVVIEEQRTAALLSDTVRLLALLGMGSPTRSPRRGPTSSTGTTGGRAMPSARPPQTAIRPPKKIPAGVVAMGPVPGIATW